MKDSYSLDASWVGLEAQYRRHHQAYFNIFGRCGLPVVSVKADVGMMGGHLAHEFIYLNPIGEDTLILCDSCGYSANRQIAEFRKIPMETDKMLPLEKVATPETKTIEALADFLGVPKSRTAKAVFLTATFSDGEMIVERFVFAVVRGDMEVNEYKLASALKALELRPAREEEIRAVGAEPGYASPVGLKDVLVVVDDIIPTSPNLVAGANEEGYHMRNVNYGRDFQAEIVADIAAAEQGSVCPRCAQPMQARRGVEVGNIFKLGTHFSESMHCTFLDQDGQQRPVIMGSYGIGSGRLLACIAEEHHDEQGLLWPISVTPYQVHLVALAGKAGPGTSPSSSISAAEQIYQELKSQGIEVLFDDREESPGVKFNDADLIGLPIRLTVSERSLKQGGVEFKRRDSTEKVITPRAETIGKIKKEISDMQAGITSRVKEVPYKE
jgi:prolyl-tRNA synthetase